MARNPYAKSVKLFSKADDLFISREKDVVYLSEGHIILKIHVAAYDAFFRPVSGQFIELSEGDAAARRGYMTMPEKNPDAPKIYQIIEKAFDDEMINPVFASPFIMEFSPDRKKKILHRMFTGNGYYVAINNDFWEVAEENGFSQFWNKGNSISGIISKSGDNGIFILPIRIDQQSLYDFIKAGAKQ